MNQVFTSVGGLTPAFNSSLAMYSYGTWGDFLPLATPDNPTIPNSWQFQKDTAVSIKAIKATLQGISGPRMADNSQAAAIALRLGFTGQRSGERQINLIVPKWDEWFSLDYLSYPSDLTPGPRMLQASPHSNALWGSNFWIDPRNMQTYYDGLPMRAVILVQCEYAETLQGV